MASTYSTSLKLELIGNGDQSGVWGTTTNKNLGTLLEQAITGVQSIEMTNADYTLTNFNGTSDEARNAVLVVTGTNAAVWKVITPLVKKTYIVYNNTTGGFDITIGGASGSVVTIPSGVTTLVYCNGTNFFTGLNGSTSNFNVSGDITATTATGSATPTPTEIRIATSTNASDWSTTLPWGRLSFYSADQSDGGAKVQGSVDFVSDSSNGGRGSLVFRTAAATTGTLTERMRINSAGNVGIGSSSLSNISLRLNNTLTGSTNAYGLYSAGTIQPDVTGNAYYNQIVSSTASNSGTPYTNTNLFYFNAAQGTFNADSTVTNQTAFFVDSSVTSAVNNYGFRSNIPVGTGRWNFYAQGAADNYFAGDVGIGVTTPNTKLEIAGSTNPTVSCTASISGTTMTVTAVSSGTLAVGQYIFNSLATISPNTYITALGTGTGAAGTYTVSISQTVASATTSAIEAAPNRVRITETDTSVAASQPVGTLEWFGSDASTPGASVKGFVQVINESTTPDTAMVFGTNDNAVGTSAVERMRISSTGIVTGTAGNLMLVSGTAQNSTSGTSIDFTSIPSWVKRITVLFNVVSTNGSSNFQIQIGDAGGVETTGYASGSTEGVTSITSTTGFTAFQSPVAARTYSGVMTIALITGNTWIYSSVLTCVSDAQTATQAAGTKTLSATLDRVRITTDNGTDAFDAGSINILYE